MSKTDHSNNDNNNYNANKYTTSVRGLPMTFATSKQININQVTQYLERTVMPGNHSFSDLILQLKEEAQDDDKKIVYLNSAFVELMDEAATLLDSYCEHVREQHSKIFARTSPNTNTMTYSFKPSKKPTAFDKYWRAQYDNLKKFKEQHGHCYVSRTTPGYSQLGNWLTDQRRKYRSGKLTQEQYQMLTELGVEWERTNQHVSL